MKFSHQIHFNAVPDWADYYLPYSNIKKLIYQLEKDKVSGSLTQPSQEDDLENAGVDERTSLMNTSQACNNKIVTVLDKSLDKIVAFYAKKETEIYTELDQLIEAVNDLQSSIDTIPEDEEISSPVRPTIPRRHSRRRSSISQPSGRFARRESTLEGESDLPPTIITHNIADEQTGLLDSSISLEYEDKEVALVELRKRVVDVFVLLSELKSFVALNLTAFGKILKKYDKITNSDLKRTYIADIVNRTYPFSNNTKTVLNDRIQTVERMYARLATDDNLDDAINELKTHLREHIVWERNTVWRDMVGQERKAVSIAVQSGTPTKIRTPFGKFSVTSAQLKKTIIAIICVSVFITLLNVKTFAGIEESNCFAILIFASLLWATELMPLFVTALMVPLLVVMLQVMRSDDGHDTRLSAPLATKRVFAQMFSPVIMLLLGGFAIAGALSKYGIAKAMATFVLAKAGTRPSRVLLMNMFVATIASMWISNVAAPVLCFSLIQPILRTLPVNSTFAPCLILGIALASNIGGMASPISSPQNIIAIQNMSPPPTWGEWFFIAIPICLIADILTWLVLLWTYKPEQTTAQIHSIRASSDPVTWTQVYVGGVTLTTIVLWCLSHAYEDVFGDMGVIAILPLIAFFGPGLLNKDDFNNFLWNVIMLAMGGIAMGKAVESSGLLHTVAIYIQQVVHGMSAFEILFIFGCLVLVIATFISHTVAALIILPIVAQVGAELDDPRPRLLVMGSALLCSGAMGLPVSGFPNMNAISMVDEMGREYLTTADFLRNGVPSSLLVLLVVTTIGYLLMSIVGY
ncbi:SPX domain-containing protein [Umbelopsis sp. AD052]|nr:SPX domain-containing protein [Umbelopsis sp. AD052]